MTFFSMVVAFGLGFMIGHHFQLEHDLRAIRLWVQRKNPPCPKASDGHHLFASYTSEAGHSIGHCIYCQKEA